MFDDLAAEYARIDGILSSLTPDQWQSPSGAVGWTVSDVVVHLAQTSEFILEAAKLVSTAVESSQPGTLDARMDELVAAERDIEPDELLSRWRAATTTSLQTLRDTPRDAKLPWAAAPLSPRTLATTRLAEHWAHTLDITEPLQIDYPDTDRLWHIGWLAHRTLPYAFMVAGQNGGVVRCELTAASGERWDYGDADAPTVVRGPAGDFCRVAAQRLTPDASSLQTSGPLGADVLRVVRTYAA